MTSHFVKELEVTKLFLIEIKINSNDQVKKDYIQVKGVHTSSMQSRRIAYYLLEVCHMRKNVDPQSALGHPPIFIIKLN